MQFVTITADVLDKWHEDARRVQDLTEAREARVILTNMMIAFRDLRELANEEWKLKSQTKDPVKCELDFNDMLRTVAALGYMTLRLRDASKAADEAATSIDAFRTIVVEAGLVGTEEEWNVDD
jgi:hypothetical protein